MLLWKRNVFENKYLIRKKKKKNHFCFKKYKICTLNTLIYTNTLINGKTISQNAKKILCHNISISLKSKFHKKELPK